MPPAAIVAFGMIGAEHVVTRTLPMIGVLDPIARIEANLRNLVGARLGAETGVLSLHFLNHVLVELFATFAVTTDSYACGNVGVSAGVDVRLIGGRGGVGRCASCCCRSNRRCG